jgi:hypothetical protein
VAFINPVALNTIGFSPWSTTPCLVGPHFFEMAMYVMASVSRVTRICGYMNIRLYYVEVAT